MRQFLLLALCSGFLAIPVKAQSQIIWERYTKAWVTDDRGVGEQRPVQELAPTMKSTRPALSLHIPERGAFVQLPNGDRYISLYLINTLPDTVAVSRADATVSGIATEVFVDGQWKIFQTTTASSCGNSYWTMKLSPGHYLPLELEDKSGGSVKVAYRVRLNVKDGPDLVSNAVRIRLTPVLLKLAGSAPPPVTL